MEILVMSPHEENFINYMVQHFKDNGDEEFIFVENFVSEFDLTVNTVKGVLGSLVKKGYIDYQDVNGEYNTYHLTYIIKKNYGLLGARELDVTELGQKFISYMVESQTQHDERGEIGFSDLMLGDFIEEFELDSMKARTTLNMLIVKGYVYTMSVNGEYDIYYVSRTVRRAYGMEEE